MHAPPPSPGPSSQARLAGVDTLRALAALAVYFCHLVPYWGLAATLPWRLPQVAQLGAHGVDVFVVVSGFCLALPVARRGGELSVVSFYRRRALRILPPYYVALAAAAALALGAGTWTWVVAERASWRDVLWHVVLLQPWTESVGTVNGSLWSVSLEVHLYLLFPLLVLWWNRWGLSSLLVSSAVLSAVWLVLLSDVPQAPLLLPARLVQFVAGMVCATLVVRGAVPARRTMAVCAAGALLVAAGFATAAWEPLSILAWAVAGGALVLFFTQGLGSALRDSAPERAGRASYSFYLVHQPVLLVSFAAFASTSVGPWVTLLIGGTATLALTALVSAAFYFAVERPTIALSARAGRRGVLSTR